ncbi:MAG: hypothetical protein JWN23_901 [Rhodocyclales bacterium]|nr:hypothetical protein [Rhodocyclales bacterium]
MTTHTALSNHAPNAAASAKNARSMRAGTPKKPAHQSHAIEVGAPRDLNGAYSPAILQRSDDDFINATLDDLRTSTGRNSLRDMLAQATNKQGVLKLYQPIQRQFHVALIESWCTTPGEPRLDPAKVDSAGMVLRRIGSNGYEGWMRSKGHVRGWTPLARVGGDDTDPGSALRLQRGLTGVADIDSKLMGYAQENSDNLLNEAITPMYVAPPDVCADAAKTLFYGIVPTSSSELSEADAEFLPPGDDSFGPQSAGFQAHLVDALRGAEMDLPFPGETLVAGWFQASQMPGDVPPAGVSQDQFDALQQDPTTSDGATARSMTRFIMLLRQLGSEFNVFEGGKEVDDLRKLLKKIDLPLVLQDDDTTQRTVQAYDFLSRASTVLLEQGAASGSMEMPESFPALSARDSVKLAAALHKAMLARLAAVKGKAGRFDEPNAQYVLRAFVRLKPMVVGGPKCIVWSDYSDPFVIAPWYDGAGAPPLQILLPDASDRDMLKSLKPNISFVVPAAMQNLLNGKSDDLMKGNGSTSGPGLAWICSFNIPIITICAFIVLNIFLSLFNIVFGWMFFLKICIPFPKFGNK